MSFIKRLHSLFDSSSPEIKSVVPKRDVVTSIDSHRVDWNSFPIKRPSPSAPITASAEKPGVIPYRSLSFNEELVIPPKEAA